MKSEIKYPKLSKEGKKKIDHAEKLMPAIQELRKRFKKELPFKDKKISMALHVTKETAVLVRTLRDAGARVYITGCNPLSTQDDVAAALAEEKDIFVFAHRGESNEEYYDFLEKIISISPNFTVDDGCDLVSHIHEKHSDKIKIIIGGTEETTTGVIRLEAMKKAKALKYPVIAVNDNDTKHLMDNHFGTGQSTLDGILRATNILFSGKKVVVAGFGDCGKGVAKRAKGLGARIIITEINPVKALEAHLEGYEVMKMDDACKLGDIFITVTGNKNVITEKHFLNMKNGAILSNSGHFDIEIAVKNLRKISKKIETVRKNLEKFDLENGKEIFLIAEGRLVNLSAAEGHPSEIMDLSFCGQALALEYLAKNEGKLENELIRLPKEIDEEIAKIKLKSLNLEIDTLTQEQVKYLSSWQEGT